MTVKLSWCHLNKLGTLGAWMLLKEALMDVLSIANFANSIESWIKSIKMESLNGWWMNLWACSYWNGLDHLNLEICIKPMLESNSHTKSTCISNESLIHFHLLIRTRLIHWATSIWNNDALSTMDLQTQHLVSWFNSGLNTTTKPWGNLENEYGNMEDSLDLKIQWSSVEY